MATTTSLPSTSPMPETTSDGAAERALAADTRRLERAVATAGRFFLFGRVASAPLRHGWLDVTYTGRENVPSDGPVVLAANHLAVIDSILVMYSLPRRVMFLGKAEYLDHRIAGRLFPATGMLPLDRGGSRARITLRRANEILRDGGIIGVHPEGTRSRDGVLGPGHPGVAQLALRANAPVVPVALVGTGAIQPIGTTMPAFRGSVELRFGAPIGLGRWATRRRTASARAELTEEIMAEIAGLSGQVRRPAEQAAGAEGAPMAGLR